MTLVAAYKVDNIPVLISDMALTKKDMRSLLRKAYIIAPNLAVAWAGHAIVAKIVIEDMRKVFSCSKPTKDTVEKFFTSYSAEDFGSLHTNFIGWIVDESPICFRWNCLYPKELFYDESFVEGSGEGYFENLRNQNLEEGGSESPPGCQSTFTVINQVARARFRESLYNSSWDLSFGASYDIFVLEGRCFRFVRSLVYIGWDYHWDSDKKTGVLQQAPVLMKHNCMGDYSILQEALHGDHYDRVTINYLARPVFDNMPDIDLSNFPLTIESDYYANYFIFREKGKVIFEVFLTIQKITNDGPLKIEVRDGAYYLHYDTEELNAIYKKHTTK